MKLFSFRNQPSANKILVTAKLCNLELEHEVVATKDFNDKGIDKLHPLRKVPCLKTEEGGIFGSDAVLRHFARLAPEMKLYGRNLL